MDYPEHWAPEARANWARAEDLARRYRDDPELRARIESGGAANEIAALGIELPPGVETRVVANSDEVWHLALPSDPNAALGDETLTDVSGGASTLGSAASVGSIGCIICSTGPSSLSSVGSAGTAGSRSV